MRQRIKTRYLYPIVPKSSRREGTSATHKYWLIEHKFKQAPVCGGVTAGWIGTSPHGYALFDENGRSVDGSIQLHLAEGIPIKEAS